MSTGRADLRNPESGLGENHGDDEIGVTNAGRYGGQRGAAGPQRAQGHWQAWPYCGGSSGSFPISDDKHREAL